MSRETFTIEEIEIKQSSRGPFRRAKLSGIGWVSFFDKADGDFLEENMGQSASAEITTNDKGFKNGKALQKAAGQVEHLGGGEKMSKEEWDHKEDRQRIGILFSVHLKQMFEWHQANPDTSPITSYKDLRVQARRAAVGDLDWIRNYAVGAVPFEQDEAPREDHEAAA